MVKIRKDRMKLALWKHALFRPRSRAGDTRKNACDLRLGIIEEALAVAPEPGIVAARLIPGAEYRIVARTGLPSTGSAMRTKASMPASPRSRVVKPRNLYATFGHPLHRALV